MAMSLSKASNNLVNHQLGSVNELVFHYYEIHYRSRIKVNKNDT